MQNSLSLTQLTNAMNISLEKLNCLLFQLGIITKDQQLSEQQVRTLLSALEHQSNDIEQRHLDNLAYLVERYVILIDTCSLLHPQFPLFIKRLSEILQQKSKKLFIPASVINELSRLKHKKKHRSTQIHNILCTLADLRNKDVIAVCGDNTEFGDQQLLETVLHFMVDSEILVITQDHELSEDLIAQKQLRSVHGKGIAVSRINQYGFLSRFRLTQNTSRSFPNQDSYVLLEPTLIGNDETLLPLHHMPNTGETVYTQQHAPLQLVQKLSNGGEGNVYDLGDGTVAKLYYPSRLTVSRKNKLELMIQHPINFPGICWPKGLLYNEANELIGYQMDYAQGIDLQRCVLNPLALNAHFPDWRRRDLIQLCLTILEKICVLHQQGIILGDINPLNIRVVSPTDVWFLDCDSYQVGGYPCPVGSTHFVAPEISGKHFSTFLRTYGNENFSVATLLFMIVMLGKQPYAQRNNKEIRKAISEMHFPYPCGENHRSDTPDGNWRFLWSHLPRYLKELFYNTFQKGGLYSTEQTRLSAKKWYASFQHYLTLLDEGRMEDPESEKLIPTRWKVTDPSKLAVYQQLICTDCNQSYEVTIGEQEYRKQRGWKLPRKCPTCRELHKLEQSNFSFDFAD